MTDREAILKLRLALGPFAIAFLSKISKEARKSKARADWLAKMPDKFPIELTLTMGICREAVKALDETEERECKCGEPLTGPSEQCGACGLNQLAR